MSKNTLLLGALLISHFMAPLFGAEPPAAEPPKRQPIDVQDYLIKLDLDPETNLTEFNGEVEITLKPLENLSVITLHAEEMTVQKVYFSRMGKIELPFEQKDGKRLEIKLDKQGIKGRPLILRVQYTAKVNQAHYGLFKVNDPDDATRGNLFFTQLEAEGARRFFPCHDVPYDKATTEIEVATRVGIDVVSNGKRVSDKTFSNAGQKWHRVRWRQSKPHSTYLVALAVAPLGKLNKPYRGIDLSVQVGKNHLGEAKYLMDSLPKLMEIQETLLKTKYPWDKYAVIGVPTFVWGGMENTSITLQNEGRTLIVDPKSAGETYKVIDLSSHELAHQWFGDLVTLNGWDDIWLNEAFATYVEGRTMQEFFKNEYPTLSMAVGIWEDYFRQEDGPRSHPIVEKNKKVSDDAFDSISYQKGANVLRTLEVFLGDNKFKAGLTAYLKKYALANATREDFFSVMSASSGESLEEFKNSWIYQRGYPVVGYEGKWDAPKHAYTLQLRQHSNHADDKTQFRFRMPVTFHRQTTPSYHVTVLMEMGTNATGLAERTVNLPETPEWVSVNPQGKVLARLETSASLPVLEAQMTQDPEPLVRLWAAREVARPLLEGRTLSDAAQASLSRWLKQEPSPYARAVMLSFFQKKYFKTLPAGLGQTVVELAQTIWGDVAKDKTAEKPADKPAERTSATSPAPAKGKYVGKFESSPTYLSDPTGWRLFQAELLGTLGKVERADMLPYLAAILGQRELSLDDTYKASVAVAQIGADQSGDVLKEAAKIHNGRGHAYRIAVDGAYGAWENPKAAAEIRTMAKTCGQDVPSRWARLVRDNPALRESSEWSESLKDILLTEDRLGEELKARLLSTVEESTSESVFRMASEVRKESKSERLKEQATKMIKKNFPNRLL